MILHNHYPTHHGPSIFYHFLHEAIVFIAVEKVVIFVSGDGKINLSEWNIAFLKLCSSIINPFWLCGIA